VIGGGYVNGVQGAEYSFIGGGSNNKIEGVVGIENVFGAFIGGGYLNAVQPSAMTAPTISGGGNNTVYASFTTIPGGQQAVATNYAQLAYSSGQFQNPGDSQYSLYVLRYTTTNSESQYLFLDGAISEVVLPGNRSCSFTARVVGRDSAGQTCAFNVRGGASSVGGVVTVAVPTATNEKLMDTWGSCSATLTSTGLADGKLRVQVTGPTSDSVRWTATLETVEVANP